MSYYTERRNNLISSFDVVHYFSGIDRWVNTRPLLRHHDRNQAFMFQKNIPGEIVEAETEMEKYGAPSYDKLALSAEVFDIGYFIGAFAQAEKLQLDHHEVRRSVNGFGNHSGIYDYMRQVSQNMSEKASSQDLQYLTSLWLALMAGLPHSISQPHLERITFDKNSRNYPFEIFSDRHPILDRKLTEEEHELAWVHYRRSLKYIRNFMRDTLKLRGNDLGKKNRDYGLHHRDYASYLHLIRDFPNGQKAFNELRIQLHVDHHLPFPAELL